MGWLAATGFGLGLAGAAVLAAIGAGYVPPAADLTLADAEAAYGGCQQFVREQLKAPGPVTFAPIGRRTARRFVDGRFRVRSHADVTNAAGRLVEIRFGCTIRPLGGDRWALESLSMSTD
jgi:hypothetical protein